jgi:hypothetical protein
LSTTQLAGLAIRNTAKLITPDTKMCGLVHAPSGFGKTTLGATLDKMTKKFFGKPSLIIAVEAGEGGGTMSIQDYGVDFIVPTNLEEFRKLIATLHTDRTYGGIVLDSASEYVHRFLKPMALKFPSREKIATRTVGVPERSDYQTMGEIARQDFNQLINLTTHPDLDIRKHLIITSLQREKQDAAGNLTAIQPDLPGSMSGVATAMFQITMSIKISNAVEKNPTTGQTERVKKRTLVTEADGILMVKDRSGAFPNNCPMDFSQVYERFWLPRIAGGSAVDQAA